jgi:signal transduction histidine kinase/ActR/RegA family two-component response regulator
MVEGRRGAAAASNDAAQVLSTILQTQYLRYLVISSWAVGLWPIAGWRTALAWWALTLGAGGVRGWVEKRLDGRVGKDYPLAFQLVGVLTGLFWAAAPVVAWTCPHPFGRALAMAYLVCGYFLVFSQLRHSPKQALLISSPYSAVVVWIVASAWGRPELAPFLAALPFIFTALLVHMIVGLVSQARITQAQARQDLLINELEQARDKAEAANRAKSTFLGVISHELRTPMNGVLGAAQLLSATRLDPTQREYVSIVRNSGDSLLALLNDILDLTKIEADRMALEQIDVDVAELVGRVGATWTPRAREKGIAYEVEIAPEAPAVIVGDPTRLSQILHNLLSNALKFTEAGEVRLKVDCERLSQTRARLVFDVTDTGPGIAAQDLERLFQPFTQLDVSSTRRFGGTGLGLTICRRLAGLMGGELNVCSTVGEGSCFTLSAEFDVRAWAAPRIEAPLTAAVGDGESLRVLVVEDHPVNRMIIEAWLASAGHVASSAENGELALEQCGIERFDLILMDVNMPVMDGLTATRQLRAAGGPNGQTAVVVLSASARAEDHDAGLAAGADAYLDKPIDFQRLASLLNRLAESGREGLKAAA